MEIDRSDKISPSLDTSVFQRFRRLYSIALTAIAFVFLISNYLIHNHLSNQIADSRVINVAGRQRMLSQKLSKEVEKIKKSDVHTERIKIAQTLQKDLSLWVDSHRGLLEGDEESGLPGENTEEVLEMYTAIESPFNKMEKHCQSIISALNKNPTIALTSLQSDIDEVLNAENSFLLGMDKIVFAYDREAKEKVQALQQTERILLFLGIGTLLLELFFIFIPIAEHIKKNIAELTFAEKEANENAKEIKKLYEQKENSVQELRALNFAVDQAALFASISLDGRLIYMSKKLADFLGYREKPQKGQFPELLTTDEGEQEYVAEIIRSMRSTMWVGESSITTLNNEKNWLELSIVPVNRDGVQQDYLILCSNITMRKQAEFEIQKLNQEKFDEEIRIQKNRSLQIIKAQETERMRIAKDMHDGIGQMLTALKFNIESLNPDKPDKIKEKMSSLKEISSDLIKGVRIATFNLTPPELTDYGIATALAKLCFELKKLTNQNIIFENKKDFDLRLDSAIETNVYRIVQEAVNNAIKYASANYILVTINHTEQLLSISIHDDGSGFDHDETQSSFNSTDLGGNMGLSFMRERAEYINSRLFISSEKGEGVRVTINVPLTSV